MRRALLASLVVLLGAAGLALVPLVLGEGDRVAYAAALVPFDGCDDLRGYLVDQALERVGPYGIEGAGSGGLMLAMEDRASSPAALSGQARESTPSAPSFSGTNVQEAGVDEPDTVKTDGSTLYAVVEGTIRSVDVRSAQPVALDSLRPHLEGGDESELQIQDLLLVADTLLAFGGTYGLGLDRAFQVEEPTPVEPGIVRWPGQMWSQRLTSVVVAVDVSDPSDLRVTGAMSVEGERVAARLSSGLVRLALRSEMPRNLAFVQPTAGDVAPEVGAVRRDDEITSEPPASGGDGARQAERATELNREVVRRSTIDEWLPRYHLSQGSDGKFDDGAGSLVECDRVSRLPEPTGLGLVSVLTIDPGGDLSPGSAPSVVGDAQIAYASSGSVYLAASHWDGVRLGVVPSTAPARWRGPWTSVHRFDISDRGEAQYRASGRVEGSVRDQWSFSEHEGRLRVTATATEGPAGPESTSVAVLREDGDRLVQVGLVAGLGRGEQVYAVRYVGDIGFVVTFRQVDPLHVIDLSDPEHPRVAGELEIPGYSAYLHPVAEGRLLGVGSDATPEGRRAGAQVSLFDVTDLASPRRTSHVSLGSGSTFVEGDHHAFLYWGPRHLAVVPFSEEPSFVEGPDSRGVATGFAGVVLLEVDEGSGAVREIGRVEHGGGEPYARGIQRSLVRGDRLLTLSSVGLMSTPLDDLGAGSFLGWVEGGPPVEPTTTFPEPAPPVIELPAPPSTPTG